MAIAIAYSHTVFFITNTFVQPRVLPRLAAWLSSRPSVLLFALFAQPSSASTTNPRQSVLGVLLVLDGVALAHHPQHRLFRGLLHLAGYDELVENLEREGGRQAGRGIERVNLCSVREGNLY